MISGILLSVLPENTGQKLLRLVCGTVLAVTALSVLPGIALPEISGTMEAHWIQGQQIAAEGENLARQEQHRHIKERLEAYIWDKGRSLGAVLDPSVILDPDGCPHGVTLSGKWTEQIRQTLMEYITNDLGIPEEDQQWIEENGANESRNGS